MADESAEVAPANTVTLTGPDDLTTFITKTKTLLISDFEGTTPTRHFGKFKEYCEEKDKQVIFLGDIFDNTAKFGDNCKGDVCLDPDNITNDCVNFENYCALKTIKLLVDNEERCRYVVGNRDINKIKIMPFFSFKDGKKWWTDGNTYADIVKKLLKVLTAPETPWIFDKMDYFAPFFNLGDDKMEDTKWKFPENIKNRNTKKINTNMYDRFEAIFGKDATVGTMSALVTLKCLPNEMLGSDNIVDFYKAVNETQNINEYSDIDVNERKNIRAALTITLFMRMLDKDLWNDDNKSKTHEISKFGALDGYLYYYLTTARAAYYAEHSNNLLLFAHGGITNEFMKEDGLIAFNKLKTVDWDKAFASTGGAEETPADIKQCIENFNKMYIDEYVRPFMDITFKYDGWELKQNSVKKLKEKEKMLTLLQLTAMDRNKVISKDNGFSIKQSPIQVKEPSGEILDNIDATAYQRIYNIFGHASSSAGYSLGKVANSKKTYYINTDFSTTLYKEGIQCVAGNTNRYNENYLIAILDGTEKDDLVLNIEGTVILSSDKKGYQKLPDDITDIQVYINNNTEKIEKKPGGNKYYVDGGKDLPKNEYRFIPTENILSMIDTFKVPENCAFNGIAKIGTGETPYNVFSTSYVKVKNVKLIYFSETNKTNNDNSQSGGRKRRRTRKHRRLTHKKKKGGKRKSKKGRRKTRRAIHKRINK